MLNPLFYKGNPASKYVGRVGVTIFGNALGDSITDAFSPTPRGRLTAKQAEEGSVEGGELEEVSVTVQKRGDSADGVTQAAVLQADTQSVAGQGGASQPIQEVVVLGKRIRPGEDAALDLFAQLQSYRPYLTPQGQGIVDSARDAADFNYYIRGQFQHNSSGSLNIIGNAYDLITGSSAGTGRASLAIGYNGGPASFTDKVIGGTLGLTLGGLEGAGRGTAFAFQFAADLPGSALYQLTGADFLASSNDRVGETVGGLVSLARNPGVIGDEVGDYFSRVGNLFNADPFASTSLVGRVGGELVAPGVGALSGVRTLSRQIARFAPELNIPLRSPIFFDVQLSAAYSGIPIALRSPIASARNAVVDANILIQAGAGKAPAIDFLEAARGSLVAGRATRYEVQGFSSIARRFDIAFDDSLNYRSVISEARELRQAFILADAGATANVRVLKVPDSRQLAVAKLSGREFVTNDLGAFKRARDLGIGARYVDSYPNPDGTPSRKAINAANYTPNPVRVR